MKILAPLLLFFLVSCISVDKVESDSKPIDHDIYADLLNRYVDIEGNVDYDGLQKDSVKLNTYLKMLSGGHPSDKGWTREEQLAYWINAYNAFTLQLMVRHYPVKSIRDIKGMIPFVNSAWDYEFITIEGIKYDLNDIEHGILRDQFKEARIHFAINCASASCPILRNEPYTAENLESQLESAAVQFINDPDRNQIAENKIAVSKIFSWFSSDFGELIPYLNQYSEVQINENADIGFREYDWDINQR